MEQKRRTIHTGTKKRKGKKTALIIGIIIALSLIFWMSYKISYGLFSTKKPDDAIFGTEEDISNLSREDLEAKYLELEDALKDKEAEIQMLEEKLDGNSNATTEDKAAESEAEEHKDTKAPEPSNTTQTPPAAPSQPTQPTQPTQPNNSNNSNNPPKEQTNTPPPAAPMPDDGLISPEDLERAADAANE